MHPLYVSVKILMFGRVNRRLVTLILYFLFLNSYFGSVFHFSIGSTNDGFIPSFISSDHYSGSHVGFVFKLGDLGLGYYTDRCHMSAVKFVQSTGTVQPAKGNKKTKKSSGLKANPRPPSGPPPSWAFL